MHVDSDLDASALLVVRPVDPDYPHGETRPLDQTATTTVLSGLQRVVAALRELGPGRRGTLGFDDEDARIPLFLGGVVEVPGEGFLLQVHPCHRGPVAAEGIRVGRNATVWFTHASGIYTWRTRVVAAGSRNAALSVGDTLTRYSRRAATRYELPHGAPPRVLLPFHDGSWRDGGRAVNLSIGGVGVLVPPHLRLSSDDVTWVRLCFPWPAVDVKVVVRHVAERPDGALCGLQFLEQPTQLTLAIRQHVSGFGLQPQLDEFGIPRG